MSDASRPPATAACCRGPLLLPVHLVRKLILLGGSVLMLTLLCGLAAVASRAARAYVDAMPNSTASVLLAVCASMSALYTAVGFAQGLADRLPFAFEAADDAAIRIVRRLTR